MAPLNPTHLESIEESISLGFKTHIDYDEGLWLDSYNVLKVYLLLCQWLPEDRYARFPIDHPSPPAFQNMYRSFDMCLKTGRSGAQST